MKKRFFLTLILVFLPTGFINAKEIKSVVKIKSKTIKSKPQVKPEIESIIKIKPEINYNENIKYEKIPEYKLEETQSKSNFDFGFDININQEEKTIDYWKVDVKTNF